MAAVRTFTLPHYHAVPIHVAVFSDVRNAAFLRAQLLAQNPDYDYAFLDASTLLTPSHILLPAFHALHAFLTTHHHKTRTPHSELVFRLSPNNNIGESYRVFGITDQSTHIVAVKLPLRQANREGDATVGEKKVGEEAGKGGDWVLDETITAESVGAFLGRVVEGSSVVVGEDGAEVGGACDVGRVRKVYKLGAGGGKKGGGVGGGGAEEERKELESIVLGIIALKGH